MAITAAMRTQVVQLYAALFGRAPEADGLGYWVSQLNSGKSFASVAQSMFAVDAARAYYPSFLTNEEIVTKFYTSVLGRAPDADGKDYWLGKLNATGATPGAVIADMIVAVTSYTGTDADALKSQALFNNKTTVGEYYAVTLVGNDVTFAKTLFTGLTDDAATVTAKKAAADGAVNPPPVGQTLTLTISATDVPKAGGADDIIIGQIGQSTTLQASDSIDGGAGNDVLRVVTDGGTAATVAGFTTANVETLEVQSQATGGTTLGLENAVGIKTIRSSSSNTDLTVNNVKAIAALEIVGSLNNQNVTVSYAAAAVSGSADVQAVSLNGNSMGTLTDNGIETLAVTTSTAASTVAAVVGDKLSKVTVAGDKGFTITGALPTSITSVDASASTGGTTFTLTNAADVSVKGGSGADSFTFTGALTSADTIDGGAGTDTLTANLAEYTGSTYAVASKITNVEVLAIADQLTGTFDASKFAGENNYRLNAGYNAATIDKADDASTVNIRAASTGTLTYNIANASDTGTNNTVNIAVGATTGVNAGTVAVAGVETVNLTASGNSANTLTVTDAAATKLTVAGSGALTLTMTGTALTTVDASTATGNLDLSAVTYKASTSATITGGAGKDSINGSGAADVINGGAGNDAIAGGAGADSITGGAGADTFSYSAVSESSGSTLDVIADFVSGTDTFNLAQLAQSTGRTNIVLKNGAAADFGSAQSAIALNSGNTQVVFQADTNTLWVDLNDDGTLNNNDLQVKLTGVTKVVAADVGGTATPGGSGNYITLNTTSAVVNASTSTNATAVSTEFNDTVNTVVANVATATVNGLGGTDTMVLTDGGNAALPATVTNVESLNTNSAGNVVTFTAGGAFKNVTGNSGVDDITTTNMVAGGTISTAGGADVVKLNADLAATTIDLGDGNDSVEVTPATLTTSLVGGAGVDTVKLMANTDIKGATISGFESLDTNGKTVTLTTAQYAAFTTSVLGSGAITFNNAGAVSDVAASTATTYNLHADGQSFTGNVANAYTITGGAGNDTFTIKAGWTAAGDAFDGAGGTADKFVLGYDVAGAIDLATTAAALANVEVFESTVNQTNGTITLDAGLTSVSLPNQTTATTITATGVTLASLTLGAANDTISLLQTAAAGGTYTFGAGNDTITDLKTGAGAVTVDFGSGNGTVTDITTHGAGALTFKFGTAVAGSTDTITIGTAGVNLNVGDIFDFATDVQSIKSSTNNANQVIVTSAANTTVLFDLNGNGSQDVGETQIVINGNNLTFSISNFNLVVATTA